jgi:hypothetical protein
VLERETRMLKRFAWRLGVVRLRLFAVQLLVVALASVDSTSPRASRMPPMSQAGIPLALVWDRAEHLRQQRWPRHWWWTCCFRERDRCEQRLQRQFSLW